MPRLKNPDARDDAPVTVEASTQIPSPQPGVLDRRLRELEEENSRLRQENQFLPSRSGMDQQFQTLIDAFPIQAFGADPDGHVRYLSEMAKQYAGIEELSPAGEGWLAAVHPDERPQAWNRWRECVADGAPFELECRLRRGSDGAFRWHLARAVPVRDSSGAVSHWLGTMLDVHDAKEFEQALRESEHRLRQVQEGAAIGSWAWDLESDQVQWSDEIYRMLQVSPDEPPTFLGFMDRIPPEDRERALGEAHQAIEARFPLVNEFRMIRGDGQVRWVQGRAQVFDKPGGGQRMVGVVMDITDRKRTEQSLQDSEARFRSIFDTAAAGMALAGIPEGRLIAVNPRLAEMTGYAIEELIGRTFFEITHPDDREANRALYGELLAGRIHSFVLDKRYRRKDGSYLWVKTTVSMVKDVDGRPRQTVAVIEDISARRQSERIYRAIGDFIPYGIWITDAAGRNIYGSQSFFDLTGSTQQECNELGWAQWLHPDDAKTLMPAWTECVRTGQMFDAEMRWRGLDGEYHPALVRGGPVRDELGVITAWAGINLDISALKRAEMELRSANADLEQFAYAAGHDLREPLRTVTSYAQLLALRQGDKLEASGKQFLEFIVGGAARMQALVDDLLFYARVMHSPNTPDDAFHPVSLSRVFEDVVAGLGTAMEESGAQIQTDPLPEIQGDSTQLAQLFQNLLSNAIKYRRVDVPLKIHLTATPEDGHFLFCFADNGMGFDPAHAERIFGVFKRLHGAEIPGTGIGLAICRRIVERHQGRIWAEGKPGEGATFCFTLPYHNIQ